MHANGGNMEKESSTKERIEQISLDLFAKYGYNAVSIRDICKKLGFTESSIYYHFKNKQAIMDSLIQKVEASVEEKEESFDERFQKANQVTEEEMGKVAIGFLVFYYLNLRFQIVQVLSHFLLLPKQAYQKSLS